MFLGGWISDPPSHGFNKSRPQGFSTRLSSWIQKWRGPCDHRLNQSFPITLSKRNPTYPSGWWLNHPSQKKKSSSKWVHLPQFFGVKITKIFELPPLSPGTPGVIPNHKGLVIRVGKGMFQEYVGKFLDSPLFWCDPLIMALFPRGNCWHCGECAP